MIGRRGRRRRKLLDERKDGEKILSFEGGSSRSPYVKELFLEEALDLSSDRILNDVESEHEKRRFPNNITDFSGDAMCFMSVGNLTLQYN